MFKTILFGLVLAYLAFGGARSLLMKDTPKTQPNTSLVYKPSAVTTTTTTTGEKRRYSF